MRRGRTALLAALAAIACVRAAAAQEAPARDAPAPAAATPAAPAPPPSLPDKLGDVPGTWDLSRDGTNRRCVMTLLPDNGEAGRRLAFPAGCRRALPVVASVVGWLFVDGNVRLVDRDVRPVLQFTPRPDQRSLVAAADGGGSYSFVPLDIVAMRPAGQDPTRLDPSGAAPAPPETPSALAATPAPAPLQTAPTIPAGLQRVPAAPRPPGPAPGTYALDRFQDRDTCRIALDGGGAVRLVPGCRDGGLEVFDPVRWRFADGRMTITAKRGHSIDLVATGDGRWRRDPEVGTTFVLRRVEP